MKILWLLVLGLVGMLLGYRSRRRAADMEQRIIDLVAELREEYEQKENEEISENLDI